MRKPKKGFFVFASILLSLGLVVGLQANDKPIEGLFVSLKKNDPEVVRATRKALSTLNEFRAQLDEPKTSGTHFSIKTYYPSKDGGVFLWWTIHKRHGDDFIGRAYEVPPELSYIRVGTSYAIVESDVVDWMIQDKGVLYGGYTVRLQRSRLKPDMQSHFDNYLKVSSYAPLP